MATAAIMATMATAATVAIAVGMTTTGGTTIAAEAPGTAAPHTCRRGNGRVSLAPVLFCRGGEADASAGGTSNRLACGKQSHHV
jgi:hypothetical protein